MKRCTLIAVALWLCLFANIRSYSQTPDWLWAKGAGGTNEDYGYSVAADASGNTYVAGFFSSDELIFGTFTLTNDGSKDMFLVKYDAGGNVLWAKSAGGPLDDRGYSVAVDISGNAYVTGYFSSPSILFGTFTLENKGFEDIFLVKYDAGGNVVWAESAAGTFHDVGNSVTLDDSGNIFLTGFFSSSEITFGDNTLTNAGGNDMFLAKYDANGNVLWAKNPYGTSQDQGCSVAADNSGNAYVAGYFSAYTYIVFGSDTLTSGGDYDVFLAKYDAGGNVQWAKGAGALGNDLATAIAVDNSGNAYMAGYFSSSAITFGTFTLTNVAGNDIFLTKYNASGNVLWAKSAGGTGIDFVYSVAVNASGDAYLTGDFSSPTLSIGTYTLTNAGGSDLFLAKYDAGGNVLWAKGNGGIGNEYGNSVAIVGSDNVCVTGYFSGSPFILGPDTLQNAGMYDVFLAKSEGGPTGISEPLANPGMLIYPDPAERVIMITLPAGETSGEAAIFNMQGKEVLRYDVTRATATIDVTCLPRGMYMIKVVGNKGTHMARFVKL
jgi:hypothetical protein